MFTIYKELKFQRIPATFSYTLRIPSTQLPIWELKVPGGRVQINLENQDRYKEHKQNRQFSLKLEETTVYPQYSLRFGPQSVIRAQCLPFAATVNSMFEAGQSTTSLYGTIPGRPPLVKCREMQAPWSVLASKPN